VLVVLIELLIKAMDIQTQQKKGETSLSQGQSLHATANHATENKSAEPPAQPSTDNTIRSQPWTPSSYRKFPIKQQPDYKDPNALDAALRKVKQLPPLVHHEEVISLKNKLAEAALGKAFLLQGGDCAERFVDCSQQPIENKFKILLQMSLILIHKARIPVIRLSRMAGQFAKPRTSPFETVNGQQVISFKGDNINSFFSKREPDPERMVQAYFHSAATLNYVRAMITGGVADLHHPDSWVLDHIQDDITRREYEKLIEKITDGLDFLKVINADKLGSLSSVDLFTSHEGLLMCYEEALTKKIKDSKSTEKYYNLGAHFLWIGDRTRDINGAHIEYFRGIANPIGVKVGPSMKIDDLVELVTVLNADKEPGRLTLITRFGHSQVEKMLPSMIQAVKKTGIPVLWVCDPCHGNTEMTSSGYKTRDIEKMLSELIKTFEIHKREGTFLGGVHLELTGDNVTECVGGSQSLGVSHLSTNYETFCDPRLNYTQSLDFAFAVASLLAARNKSTSTS